MASVVMPSSAALGQSSSSSPRRTLKRPAPMNAVAARSPTVPLIKTPGLSVRSPGLSSDTMLPSQLPRSPLSPSIAAIRNDDMKTPITPPSAYADFLQALSPAMSTPATAKSSYSTFSFTDRNGHLTPVTQPPSAASFSNHSANESKRRAPPPFPTTASAPAVMTASSAPLVPPSPFVRPPISRRSSSARSVTTLKKLSIPDSPSFSPITESAGNSAVTRTPASAGHGATQTRSAYSFTESHHELRSPFSPTSWYQEGRTRAVIEPPKSDSMQTVSVRQVVTRTVTYTRTPLEPAPKRRRRMAKSAAAMPTDRTLHQSSASSGKDEGKEALEEEDTKSEMTEEGSVTTDTTDSVSERSEKEGSVDTVVVKVEAPSQE